MRASGAGTGASPSELGLRRGQLHVNATASAMKNFPDAAFSPEVIELMSRALESSVATLPDPVSTSQITLIAESILRTAHDGEREVDALQRIALLELALTSGS
ncbi:hypothetical protein [Bradyrhizobium sp. ISRA443]|uniref:hypothetical protein n=1 Tax=unclassified Bradyrhizobium TaxID=2631580 RepID=UPI0032AF225F